MNKFQNTQLFRLKQGTLPWFLVVQYMSGKTNLAADNTSRYPTLSSEINLHDGDLTNKSLLIPSLSNEVRRSIATLGKKF